MNIPIKAARAAVLALAGTLLATAAVAQGAAPADPARAGAYLAANCANCHGTQGRSVGAMPGLAGQKKEFIVEQMRAFRDGKRAGTIMHQLSKGYTDQQIDLIATHFAKQR